MSLASLISGLLVDTTTIKIIFGMMMNRNRKEKLSQSLSLNLVQSRKASKSLLPASRREFLDNAEKHRVRAYKKSFIRDLNVLESEQEIRDYVQEILNGKSKI